MLINSIPTVLIPAQQWARRSGNGRGSVACTDNTGSGSTRSQPCAWVSHIWLRCNPEDETQLGMMIPRRHTVDNVASWFVQRGDVLLADNQPNQSTSNEEANGVESQPKYDATSLNESVGSPKLAMLITAGQHGDGGLIVPNGWPVIGSAVGIQSDRGDEYKSTAMKTKTHTLGVRRTVFVSGQRHERRNASAF